MDYVKIELSSIEAIDDLDEEQAGKLLKALMHYVKDGTMPSLTGAERIAFKFLKPQIDETISSHESKMEKLRENASKGGRPRKAIGSDQTNSNPIAVSENQMVSTEHEKNQMVSTVSENNQMVSAVVEENQMDSKENQMVSEKTNF